ncbi:hypothetical protein B0H17DRAFT_1038775 [Mycena rosella]|uniref:Uncharacterized protein n=1 Tax=Mycena rosella TaxID=1033263 RepID=A0AAD7GTF9_MYCRO|nr:hypothetical protein B0H17DRAFT_1038775 [Mycena rosella]
MSTTSTYFKEGPLPSLSKDEEDALDLVIYNIEIAAEEYNVDELERSIRQVWEAALCIGVKHGQREARQAHANTTKELEQERVWGFDVGWKLCAAQLQSHVPQTSLIPSSHPPPRSLSVAATQMDITPIVFAAAPAFLPAPASAPTPTPLDWAEDAATLPIIPLHSAAPPSTPRDFSALCTDSPQLFPSLQRRRRRSPRPASSSLPNPVPHHSIRRPPQKSSVHYTATRRTPPSYPRPPISIPIPAPTSSPLSDKPAAKFLLDWDQDPRLRDLGQALAALGWARLGGV